MSEPSLIVEAPTPGEDVELSAADLDAMDDAEDAVALAAATTKEGGNGPTGTGNEFGDQSIIQLLAARLAPSAGGEGVVASTTANSVADPASVVGPSSAATEPESEAVLPPAEEPVLPLEEQEIMFFARLEQDPFPEDGTGVSFLMDKPYCVIGRRTAIEDPVQVSIDSTKVSRRHARIQYNYGIGAYEILVWGRNGCWIEYPEWYDLAPATDPERKLFAEGTETPTAVPLVHDSVISIGGTRLRFLLPDPPEAAFRSKIQKGKKRKTPHGFTSPTDSDSDDPNDPLREQYQKPPYPYSYLIAQAILSSEKKKLTLSAIYQDISARYPYFRMDVTGWQNSVRHNLSLNRAFVKVKRPENEPGKGAFWMLAAGTEEQFSQPITYRRKSAAASASNSRPDTPVFGADGEGGDEFGGLVGEPGEEDGMEVDPSNSGEPVKPVAVKAEAAEEGGPTKKVKRSPAKAAAAGKAAVTAIPPPTETKARPGKAAKATPAKSAKAAAAVPAPITAIPPPPLAEAKPAKGAKATPAKGATKATPAKSAPAKAATPAPAAVPAPAPPAAQVKLTPAKRSPTRGAAAAAAAEAPASTEKAAVPAPVKKPVAKRAVPKRGAAAAGATDTENEA